MSDPLPRTLSWLKPPLGTAAPDLSLAGEGEDITGLYPWRVGDRLTQGLASLIACRGLRVADLGCGHGQLGFQALALGAHSVLFSDASRMVVDFIQRLLAANALEDRAAAVVHAWGPPLPLAPYDLLLGGDILYRPECFADLLRTIASSLAPGGTCLLVDPRISLDSELPDLAVTQGLRWQVRRHDDGYTLVRLNHLAGLVQ